MTDTSQLPLTLDPDGDHRCPCVRTHVPEPQELHRHHVWPTGEGGPNIRANLRWICPTSHSSVHKLWRSYEAAGGTPPWSVRAHFNTYVRGLVAQGWAQAHP